MTTRLPDDIRRADELLRARLRSVITSGQTTVLGSVRDFWPRNKHLSARTANAPVIFDSTLNRNFAVDGYRVRIGLPVRSQLTKYRFLGTLLMNAIEKLQSGFGHVERFAAEWDESKHPRADDGKFGSGHGEGGGKLPAEAAGSAGEYVQVVPVTKDAGYHTKMTDYPLEDKGKWYGDEDYKARGGTLEFISPQVFLDNAKPLEMDEETEENIEILKQHILDGKKLDPLAIYGDKSSVRNSDGRHRAMAAIELGIDSVPVLNLTGKGKLTPESKGPDAVDIDSLSKGTLSKLSKKMNSLGFDIRGADDAREILKISQRDGASLLDWHDDWKQAYADVAHADVARKEKAALKKDQSPHVNWARLRALGYTRNWNETGYISPDGKQLDFSGKGEGGTPDSRAYDHREAGGVPGMQELIAIGYVRVLPESGNIDIGKEPSPKQYSQIAAFLKHARDYSHDEPTLDLTDGLGEWDKSMEQYGGARRFSRTYRVGVNPSRIIADIRAFYSGKVPVAYAKQPKLKGCHGSDKVSSRALGEEVPDAYTKQPESMPGQQGLFDEAKHPRDEGGKFTDGHQGATFTSPEFSNRYPVSAKILDASPKDSDINNPHVIVGDAGGSGEARFGVKVPVDALQHFVSDLSGDMSHLKQHGDADDPDVQAVVDGKAKMIGKGDDSVVFEHGDTIIKASTTVPYHPLGGGEHHSVASSMDRAVEQFAVAKALFKAGVTGIPRQKLRPHGDKVFTIREKMDIPDELTREQLDTVQQSIEEIHAAGYSLNDDIQVGIGKDGNVYHFDTGKAGKLDGDGKHAKESDWDNLKRLYSNNGERLNAASGMSMKDAVGKIETNLSLLRSRMERTGDIPDSRYLDKIDDVISHLGDKLGDKAAAAYYDDQRDRAIFGMKDDEKPLPLPKPASLSRYAKQPKSQSGQRPLWEESKHPRGQTENAGQFATVPVGQGDGKLPNEVEAESEADDAKSAADDWKENRHRSRYFKAWFGDWEHDADNASKVVDEETGEPQETAPVNGVSSKVVRDGKPVSVYHGTPAGGWEEFDISKLSDPDDLLYGPGFYFTEDETIAQEYADNPPTVDYHPKDWAAIESKIVSLLPDDYKLQEKPRTGSGFAASAEINLIYKSGQQPYKNVRIAHESGASPGKWTLNQVTINDDLLMRDDAEFRPLHDYLKGLMPRREVKNVYLNIRNPFDIDSGEIPEAEADAMFDKWDAIDWDQFPTGDDYNTWGELLKETGGADYIRGNSAAEKRYMSGWLEDTGSIPAGVLYSHLSSAFGKGGSNWILKQIGYDGLTHIGGNIMGGGHEHRVWIAFDPKQIKGTDNAGTFDANDNRINYAKQPKSSPGQRGLFDEAKHPRDDGGQFSESQGGGGAVRELSDQQKSIRDYTENFNQVSGDPPSATSRNLHRAIGYLHNARNHYDRQLQRGDITRQSYDEMSAGAESEIDWYGRILKERGDYSGGGPYSDEDQHPADIENDSFAPTATAKALAAESVDNDENISETMRRNGYNPIKDRDLRNAIADARDAIAEERKPKPSDARKKAIEKRQAVDKAVKDAVGTALDKIVDSGQARAKKGGEFGPNGEWYPPGSFIATTDMPKKARDKRDKAAARGQYVEPGKRATPEPGKKSIFSAIETGVNWGDGTVNDQAVAYYGMDAEKVAELAKKYSDGERWIDVEDYPGFSDFDDLARMAKGGVPIKHKTLGRMAGFRGETVDELKASIGVREVAAKYARQPGSSPGQTGLFDESKHPRGQPDNAGQFAAVAEWRESADRPEDGSDEPTEVGTDEYHEWRKRTYDSLTDRHHATPTSFLTGTSNNDTRAAAKENAGLGLLVTPDTMRYLDHAKDYSHIAIDNGVWAEFASGKPFNRDKFLALAKLVSEDPELRKRVAFIAAPDVVGDAKASAKRAAPFLPILRKMGLPVAYVAQDGIENDMGSIPWDKFDVLFLGGSTAWKMGFNPIDGAPFRPTDGELQASGINRGHIDLIREAKKHGKRVHVGRVNSWKRAEYSAVGVEADTMDGNYIAAAPDKNLPDVLNWLDRIAGETPPEDVSKYARQPKSSPGPAGLTHAEALSEAMEGSTRKVASYAHNGHRLRYAWGQLEPWGQPEPAAPSAALGGLQVGETKSENGVTYRLNENHRWERTDKDDLIGDVQDVSQEQQTDKPHPILSGLMLALRESPEYKAGGGVSTHDVAPEHAQAAYGWLQKNAGQNAGGGRVVDLGRGVHGYASTEGAMVFSPSEGGGMSVSYTNQTKMAGHTIEDVKPQPGLSEPPDESPPGAEDRPLEPESLPGDEDTSEIDMSAEDTAVLAEGVDEPQQPQQPQQPPESTANRPPIRPERHREKADAARQALDEAVDAWEENSALGLDRHGQADWKRHVSTLRGQWRERESIAKHMERGLAAEQRADAKVAKSAEREEKTKARERRKTEKEAHRRILGSEGGKGRPKREPKAPRQESNPLLDAPGGGGNVPGSDKPKDYWGMSKSAQKAFDGLAGEMDNAGLEPTDANRKALEGALLSGQVGGTSDLRGVMATAKRLHTRGNLRDSDAKSVAEAVGRRTRREPKESWKSQVKTQADAWGISPGDYEEAATEVWKSKSEHIDAVSKAGKAARMLTGLSQKDINSLENQGYDSGSKHDKTKALDTIGREMAGQFPELGWGRGAESGDYDDDTDYGEHVWNLIRDGEQKAPSRTSPEYHEAVDEYLNSQMGPPDGDDDDEERESPGGWDEGTEEQGGVFDEEENERAVEEQGKAWEESIFSDSPWLRPGAMAPPTTRDRPHSPGTEDEDDDEAAPFMRKGWKRRYYRRRIRYTGVFDESKHPRATDDG